MSGAEALGIVFGILPLLISAAEHWDDVLRPFKRYRKFAPELEKFQQQLKTQKTIFRNESCLLLSILAGQDTAKNMLQRPNHPLWTDKVLDQNFASQLGDSGEACESTIMAIELKLKELELKAEGFGTVLQQVPLVSVGDKSWRSRLAKKLKFAFSELRIENLLDDLRNLNRDFLTLSAQSSRLEIKQIEVTHPRPPPATEEKIKEFQNVQKAFLQLHNALGKACQLHAEHSAHFCLAPEHTQAIGSNSPLVRFNIAFTHIIGNATGTKTPVWISIDSILKESMPTEHSSGIINHDLTNRVLSSLTGNLKRKQEVANEPTDEKPRSLKKKHVTFIVTTAERIQESPFVPTSNTLPDTLLDPTLPDFCVQHDFCKRIQNCSHQRQTKIGYFEKAGPCKHLVYVSPQIVACQTRKPRSLAHIVSSIAEKCEMQKLLQYERLRLAKQLAAAVLQFHATPLMKGSWRSEDVVFFDIREDAKQQNNTLQSPHFNVHVQKSQQGSLISDSGNVPNQGLIRNSYLFSLGVVLLELAYQAPLRSLQDASDLNTGFDIKHVEFFAATRLSNNMKPVLGLTYANIVKKCLACDFGHGNDLNDPVLQGVFYQDVVCELERLEGVFARLQLGD